MGSCQGVGATGGSSTRVKVNESTFSDAKSVLHDSS